MILISRNEFLTARKAGFKCKEPFTRTAHGRKYAISDEDYAMMVKFISKKFKITEYR